MMAPIIERITKLKRYHHSVPKTTKPITGLTPLYANPTKTMEIGKSALMMNSKSRVSKLIKHPTR